MELSARRPGPDVVRALAMAGVVAMNYHGYLIIKGGDRGDGALDALFDPWVGPLSTRFAATFVVTAGVAVTLMTASAVRAAAAGDPQRLTEMRWRLARRGILLVAVGKLFDFVWPGTILPFYGAMFVLAAPAFTLRTRWLLAAGTAAALAGWSIRWWRLERDLDGHDTSWLTTPGPRSPRGVVLDLFVNGTHPLLPWLAFFCAGIALGRAIASDRWRLPVGALGAALFVASKVVTRLGDGERARIVLSDDPFERGLVYVASALGTALVAFTVVWWIADRFAEAPIVDVLRRAGQMSLTIYVAHALVFNLVVDWLDLVEPGGLGRALAFAAGYWIVATTLAIAYQRRFGRGPAEHLYRRLTA